MNRLDRLYWRLDLNGRDGKPANSKVLHAIGLCLAWIVVGLVAWRMDDVGSDFVLLVLAALAASGGPDTLKAFFKSRAGGVADALRERERQAPARTRASMELAERRERASAEHAGTELTS